MCCLCSRVCSWRQGLADWVPLSSVAELRGIFATAFDAPDELPVAKKGGAAAAAAGRNHAAAASVGAAAAASSSSSSSSAAPVDPLARWFYLDKYRAQQGPVRKDEIVRLYKLLQINDASMVWSDELAGNAAAAAATPQAWMRLAECPAFDGLIGPEVLEASRAERDAFLAAQAADKEKKRKRAAASATTSKWKKGNANHSNVYFTGLPLDVTAEELFEVARKAGIILTDESNGGARRIKLYTDENGKNKGDALVKYALPDSVQLAIDLLDGSVFRPAKSKLNPSNEPVIIHVEKAEFSMHGAAFDESKMDARAKEKAAIKRAKLAGGAAAAEAAKAQVGALTAAEIARQKLAESLSWGDEDAYGSTSGSSKLRIVILKPMFTLAEAAAHEDGPAAYYRELKEEIGTEVEAKVAAAMRAAAGDHSSAGAPACIEKLTVFAGHPEGPVAVKFRNSAQAAACISLMNGRMFAGSKLAAFYFDGKTNYVVDPKGSKEDEAETERRLKEFGDWIEGDAEEDD